MGKAFGAVWVLMFVANLALIGAIIFGIVKACDYVTSGKAANHVEQIKQSK